MKLILFTISLFPIFNKISFAQEAVTPHCNDIQDTPWSAAADGDVNGKYNVKPDKVFASYNFLKFYDSCDVGYQFSELQINSKKIKLQNWCMEKVRREFNNDSLRNAMSRTYSFLARPGDTISFFRIFSWYNTIKQNRVYSSSGNISFSVELIDATSGKRLALLDSVFVRKQTVPTVSPIISSMFPMVFKPKYIIPNGVNESNCYIRVSGYQGEGSEYYIYRKDEMTIDISTTFLNDPDLIQFSKGVSIYQQIINFLN